MGRRTGRTPSQVLDQRPHHALGGAPRTVGRAYGLHDVLENRGALDHAPGAGGHPPEVGVSANGTFQFSTAGAAKTIDFNARQHTSAGAADGEMTFSGPAEISGQDVDGDGTPDPGTLTNLTVKVKFDCLVVNGNRRGGSSFAS